MEKQSNFHRYLVPNSYCFMDMNTSIHIRQWPASPTTAKVYTIRIYLSNFPDGA